MHSGGSWWSTFGTRSDVHANSTRRDCGCVQIVSSPWDMFLHDFHLSPISMTSRLYVRTYQLVACLVHMGRNMTPRLELLACVVVAGREDDHT